MAKKKNDDYGILMTEQEFYYGRLLKNGTMSADSKPIGQDEILNAFAVMFERHCDREQTSEQWIGIEDGGAILIKRYTADELREAATKAAKAADKREQTGARSQSAERKQARPQVKKADRKKKK